MNQKQIRAAVEAMLFAYAEPIGADKLAQALQLPTASVESALEALHHGRVPAVLWPVQSGRSAPGAGHGK